MGIASLLLGKENPFAQWAGENQNFLGALGAGLGQGQNIQGGLSAGLSMVPEAKMLDREAAEKLKADKLAENHLNATQNWVQANYPQYAHLPPAQAWEAAMLAEKEKISGGTAPSQTQDIQEYEYARQNGFTGTFPQWMTSSKQPQTVINNSMGGTGDFYKKLDENLGVQVSDAISAGTNARSNQLRVSELERLLQTAPQGLQGGMVQAAGALGLPVEGLDDVQAAQALINQMVPLQRPPGSGTMSDADLALFKASLPQIINQPGGNQNILGAIKAINEYTIAQADIAQRVANREISPEEGRKLQAAVPNPLAGLRGGGATPTAPNDPLGLR